MDRATEAISWIIRSFQIGDWVAAIALLVFGLYYLYEGIAGYPRFARQVRRKLDRIADRRDPFFIMYEAAVPTTERIVRWLLITWCFVEVVLIVLPSAVLANYTFINFVKIKLFGIV